VGAKIACFQLFDLLPSHPYRTSLSLSLSLNLSLNLNLNLSLSLSLSLSLNTERRVSKSQIA